jgi:hypothetical protein
MGSLDVYGWVGHEMEIDSHIKTRVIFQIVNDKHTQLAWYMFAEDIRNQWTAGFDLASIGNRKLDRNEVFGDVISYPTLNSASGSDITKFAPHIGPRLGAAATLDMTDNRDKTITCSVRGLVDSKRNLVDLDFDLEKVGERREFDYKRTGRVFFLGVEKFTVGAQKKALHPLKALSGGVDPFDPIW